MPAVFAITLFVSATVLFVVEPMLAKMILPKFGGTPAVWNTCMVFYQAALLGGYGYAHAAAAKLGVRRSAAFHVVMLLIALLLAPLITFPVTYAQDWAPPGDANPIPWLLGLLLFTVGFPFFVVSATAPLLQKWFAGTGHPGAENPYYLYAASNLGSMIALLGYPLVMEREDLLLDTQGWMWVGGFAVLFVMTVYCAVLYWRAAKPMEVKRRTESADAVRKRLLASAPMRRERLYWVVLAFVPSSLMLGVTTFISTDVAPIAMIWVIPLALYLLSFVLVFSTLPDWFHRIFPWLLPPLVLLQIYILQFNEAGDASPPLIRVTATEFFRWFDMSPKPKFVTLTLQVGVLLAVFFVTAMVCHGQLARRRPAPDHLTEFYLWMSFGGVLGGLFNGIIAPVVFPTLLEYPVAIVLACVLLPAFRNGSTSKAALYFDLIFPVIFGCLTLRYLVLLQSWGPGDALVDMMRKLVTKPDGPAVEAEVLIKHARYVGQFAVPVLACALFAVRPLRFGLGVAALMLAFAAYNAWNSNEVLLRQRSFFGTLRVDKSMKSGKAYHRMLHGTTLHGMQRRPEADRDSAGANPDEEAQPLTYYHRTGPIGQVFESLQRDNRKSPAALIGLGTGSLAYYAQPGQEFTFYEIDPLVKQIAEDPRSFTYLSTCRKKPGTKCEVILGDARLSLRNAPEHHYGIIAVDAFSSDAIPVHLITREAIQLYLSKLSDDGLIAFHISNNYLNLEPVLQNLALDAGLVGYINSDHENPPEKSHATWVVLARKPEDFGKFVHWPGWQKLKDTKDTKVGVWTDHYANLLRVLRW